MGRVKDKLLDLEEEGIIIWSYDLNTYIAVADQVDPVPFDLAQYLFELHREQSNGEA